MAHPAADWLVAGRVGRAHGLDGSFYVREASPQLLALGSEVVIEGRRSRVLRRAGDDRRPIVRLEGYPDRAAAEALNGQQLLVQRTEAPELGSDEWWAEDLVGCAVSDAGREVGVVVGLLALPSCEALEVAQPEGDQLLVPLVSDAVRTVDVERKQIDVDLRFLGVA